MQGQLCREGPLLESLAGTVIILPRLVPSLRPVTKHSRKATLSAKYADPAAWDLQTVVGMVDNFLTVTQAKTVPDLAEWRILPDKARTH